MTLIPYFAYGSNMLRQRMAARCLSARWLGVANLPDHRLIFEKPSMDGSGKCAFEVCAGEGVPGVLWHLDTADREFVDRREGVGHGYEAATVEVLDVSGRATTAFAYRATARQRGLYPYDWYWALVLAGALQNELPEQHLALLRKTPRLADSVPFRPTRLDALRALREAGFTKLLYE